MANWATNMWYLVAQTLVIVAHNKQYTEGNGLCQVANLDYLDVMFSSPHKF